MALFGGSFDPPHRAHAAIARAAADSFQLDKVLFTPTGRQPMKLHGASASYCDRMEMTSFLCATDPRFELSAMDAPRSDNRPNYTIDTLEQAKGEMPPSTNLFVILGADSFADLPKWHRAHHLLPLAEWIIVSRPGFALPKLPEKAWPRVHLLEGVHEDISATRLRNRLSRGEDCYAFLLPTVTEYIRQHNLYEGSVDLGPEAEGKRLP